MSSQTELYEVDPVPSDKIQRVLTPMDLLSTALNNKSGIDVIERLAALQEKAMARDAEMQFNEAMNAAQKDIPLVAPDLSNSQTSSKYASYKALDKVIRPIYVRHGFSLSFNEGESPKPEHVRVICYCSHTAGHTRTYQKDIACDGKGPKGNDVMTKTHAEGSAMSYGMRYLLRAIFNVAVGEEDNDGNLSNGWLAEKLERIEKCGTAQVLQEVFTAAYNEAKARGAKDARIALIDARDKRRKELQ